MDVRLLDEIGPVVGAAQIVDVLIDVLDPFVNRGGGVNGFVRVARRGIEQGERASPVRKLFEPTRDVEFRERIAVVDGDILTDVLATDDVIEPTQAELVRGNASLGRELALDVRGGVRAVRATSISCVSIKCASSARSRSRA